MANLNIRRGEGRQEMSGWDPLHSTDPMRAFDPFRMIRDIMGADPFAGMVSPDGGMFAPDIEIKENKEGYCVCADLPGVKPDDLEVSVTGNRLTIHGSRKEEQRREDDRYFAYERSYGSFSRSFVLPEGADLDTLRAELSDGVLQITIPKKAEMQPRRIEVGGKESKAVAAAPKTEQKGEQKKAA